MFLEKMHLLKTMPKNLLWSYSSLTFSQQIVYQSGWLFSELTLVLVLEDEPLYDVVKVALKITGPDGCVMVPQTEKYLFL